MNKLQTATFAFLFTVLLWLWFAESAALALFAAGAILGVVYMTAWEWWLDRRMRKEIMEEIDALTRNYDCQMSLFETKEK